MITKRLSVLGIGLALFGMLGGCGSGDDPGTAVKDSPLSGNVGAQPFTAKSAFSEINSGLASITIHGTDLTCSSRYSDSGTQILFNVDSWMDGYNYQLGGSVDGPLGLSLPKYSVTLVTNGSNNNIVSKGRVEVVKASTSTTPGTVRLRVDGGDTDTVEGQVTVTQCDD